MKALHGLLLLTGVAVTACASGPQPRANPQAEPVSTRQIDQRLASAATLVDAGRTAEAIQAYSGLIHDRPRVPESYVRLAALYTGQGDSASAGIVMDTLARLNPEYAAAHPDAGQPLVHADSTVPTAPAESALPASETAALSDWAAAWSHQDVGAYFSAYSDQFAPENGQSREQWVQERRERILRANNISVVLDHVQAVRSGDISTVVLLQHYRADQYRDTTRKTLKLALENGQWRILREVSR